MADNFINSNSDIYHSRIDAKENAIAKGAEAYIYKENWNGIETVVKVRLPKQYRDQGIDKKIREQRTKIEVNNMQRAAKALKVPKVFEFNSDFIRMEFIDGNHVKLNEESAYNLGFLLSKLHHLNIVHNDLTIANVLEKNKELYVIDFGLSFYTLRIEDKASDLYCTYASFGNYKDLVLKGYLEGSEDKELGNKIIKQLDDIRKRMRYA
jgi:Kae1-associated kinase Bud32